MSDLERRIAEIQSHLPFPIRMGDEVRPRCPDPCGRFFFHGPAYNDDGGKPSVLVRRLSGYRSYFLEYPLDDFKLQFMIRENI